MDSTSLRLLEWEAIRCMVSERCACSLGGELAAQMEPAVEPSAVRLLQEETAAAAELLARGGIPRGGIVDIREPVARAARGAALSGPELVATGFCAAALERLRLHLLHHSPATSPLSTRMAVVASLDGIASLLIAAFDEDGVLKDTASPALGRLRGEVRTVARRMTEKISAMARDPAWRDLLQSSAVVTRAGRFCLQVKSDHRAQFPGLIHGQSGSGSTLFMEPAALVEMGNRLRQAEMETKVEEERLLAHLSNRTGESAEDLQAALAAAGWVDFVAARAELGLRKNWAPAGISPEPLLNLAQARHPLLAGEVTPVSFRLGGPARVMVITGPNTGGKTVTLKLAGLLAMMNQAGLWLPASPSSRLPVFAGVLADIGDEQSLQQSLSTFSGHVRRIQEILEKLAAQPALQLVLLDELGAGTDPEEGSALACALLEELLSHPCLAVVTSHFGEMKEVAYRTDGAVNASVEFDPVSLEPAYRLLEGIPGSSNALTIAARLGLQESVIRRARERLGPERLEAGRLIEKLLQDTRLAEERLRQAEEAASHAEKRQCEAAAELERLRRERTETLEKTRAAAAEIMRQARVEAGAVQQELRKLQKRAGEGDVRITPQEATRLRERGKRVERRLEHAENRAERQVRRIEPAAEQGARAGAQMPAPTAGDTVWLPRWQQAGRVLSADSAGSLQVLIGSMRVSVRADQVEVREAASAPPVRRQPENIAAIQREKALTLPAELQIRRLRAEEALRLLDEYLDDACAAGASSIRIVHGKGSGILRRLVWERLRAHPYVSGFHHPEAAAGGEGVTVVELEK